MHYIKRTRSNFARKAQSSLYATALCKTGNRLDTYTEQDQSAVAKYEQFMARDIQGHHFQIPVSPISCMIDSGSNVSSSIGKLSNCIIYADIMKVFRRFFHRVSIIICVLTNSCKLCDIM